MIVPATRRSSDGSFVQWNLIRPNTGRCGRADVANKLLKIRKQKKGDKAPMCCECGKVLEGSKLERKTTAVSTLFWMVIITWVELSIECK